MASGRLVFSNWMPALDADGVPIPNAQMFFYVNRTTTLAVIYADEALTTPLANPVLADSSGQFVPVWADQDLLFSAAVASTTLGQFDTIDDLAPSNSVGGATNKLDRDGGNPDPDFFTNLAPTVNPLTDAPTFRAALGVSLTSPRDYGAAGNGSTDDRQALFDADAAGPVTLTENYRVSSNLTFTKPVTFTGNGRLTIDTGVTVTFSQQPEAPFRQVFYGLGAVLGLRNSQPVWFAGDVMNTTTDALTLLQKAHTAVVPYGSVTYEPGNYFTITGATAISNVKGQQVIMTGAQIQFTSRTSNIMTFSGLTGGKVVDGTITCTNSYWCTAGTAFTITSGFFTMEGTNVQNSFNALYCEGVPVVRLNRINFGEAYNCGYFVNRCTDAWISNFIISAPVDWWEVSGIVGTFQPGELVQGSITGAQGDFIGTPSVTTLLRVATRNINPQVGETITGLTSGATATLVQQVVPYQIGAIRLIEGVEGFVANVGETIGGKLNLTTDCTVYAPGSRPAYNKFFGVLFDSADDGISINATISTEFDNCWISNRPGKACTLQNCDAITFVGGRAINCWQEAVVVKGSARNTRFLGFEARGNGVATPNMFASVLIEASTEPFVAIGCNFSQGDIGFGTPKCGLEVATGTTSQYRLSSNLGVIIDNGDPFLTSTPTPSSSGGTFGSATAILKYRRNSGRVELSLCKIDITTVGSAADVIQVPLPFTAKYTTVLVGTDLAAPGEIVQGIITGGTNLLLIKKANGGSAIHAGADINLNGEFAGV